MVEILQVMIITSEYPTPDQPGAAPFIVSEVESLRSAGVSIDVFSFHGRKRLSNYINAWIQARKKMKSKKYDLVHAQFGQSALLALFPKIYPLVITFRGSDVEGIPDKNGRYTFQGKILQLVSRYTAAKADECILVSSSMIKKLPKREYHIIPSGIDLDLFKPMAKDDARRTLGLSFEKQYVLFGGNPEQPVKRYHLALEVIHRVHENLPNLELITPRNVPHTMMPVYMNASDALLMTSSHEGSPNMVKEALACDLPIISTNVGDVKERIGKVDGCFVSETDDSEQIADYVITALNRRKRFTGRSHVLDLDKGKTIIKVLNVYHQALKRQTQ